MFIKRVRLYIYNSHNTFHCNSLLVSDEIMQDLFKKYRWQQTRDIFQYIHSFESYEGFKSHNKQRYIIKLLIKVVDVFVDLRPTGVSKISSPCTV